LFAIILGYFVVKIIKWDRLVAAFVITIYIYLNLTSQRVSFIKPTGMPEGINTSDIDKASNIISRNVKGEFNVAEVLDFDKRAYVLRYFTEYKYGKKPLGETQYQNIKELYVLSQKGYNFDKSDVWEVYAGGKYNVSLLSDVGKGYAVYKLTK